jgi:hypothetical protein
MEKLQNIGQLCRQHYEKIILSVALLLLAGAVIYVFNESKTQAAKIREIPIGYEKKKVNPVQPVEMSGFLAVLKQAEKPLVLDFSGPHNLFNPVQWRINKGSKDVIKVVSPDLIGPNAMRIVGIRPLHLSVAFGQAVTSGTGADLVVNGYRMYVTNELATALTPRITRPLVSVNATNKDAPLFFATSKAPRWNPSSSPPIQEGGEKFSSPRPTVFQDHRNEADLLPSQFDQHHWICSQGSLRRYRGSAVQSRGHHAERGCIVRRLKRKTSLDHEICCAVIGRP